MCKASIEFTHHIFIEHAVRTDEAVPSMFHDGMGQEKHYEAGLSPKKKSCNTTTKRKGAIEKRVMARTE